jgi:hypothetical protein
LVDQDVAEHLELDPQLGAAGAGACRGGGEKFHMRDAPSSRVGLLMTAGSPQMVKRSAGPPNFLRSVGATRRAVMPG